MKRLLWNSKVFTFQNLKTYLKENTLDTESIITPFTIFCLIAHPIFYLVNLYLLAPESYNNPIFRIFISLPCFLLLLKNYWPKNMRCYLPWMWYGTLLAAMPLFATFMLLKNHFSAAWCLNFIAILVLMMLLMNWVLYTILLNLGILLGFLFYYFTTSRSFAFFVDPTPLSLSDFLTTCAISLIMGVVFSRKKNLIEQGKIQAMKVVGANIAHELRTPLASIESGIVGAKMYFPKLLDSYKLSKENKMNVPYISSGHFETLASLLDELEKETRYSNTIIDMLLMKSKQRGFSKTNFSICSINYCIDEALRRYPFKEKELQLIDRDKQEDFNFKGESLLILHIFFNLIKNALYFIEQEGKGTIKIWYEQSLQYNIVHFKDTAKGISDYVMPRLFEKFHSYSNSGTGLGLAFCKMVMQSVEGDIKCQSNYGEFTDFTLYFPRIRS